MMGYDVARQVPAGAPRGAVPGRPQALYPPLAYTTASSAGFLGCLDVRVRILRPSGEDRVTSSSWNSRFNARSSSGAFCVCVFSCSSLANASETFLGMFREDKRGRSSRSSHLPNDWVGNQCLLRTHTP